MGKCSTLSSPRDGLLVICEIETLSVYIDLPPLVEGVIPAPTEAIEVSLPSDSYQDFSFFDSGISGLIFTIDLLIADNETPVINNSKNERNISVFYSIRYSLNPLLPIFY